MYYIIVNPASKSGRGAVIWSALEPVLKEKKVSYRTFFSKEAGHVTGIVRELTDSVNDNAKETPLRLIVLGGDGTLNEVLQGITDFSKVQVGYIPTGSSNDMARDLKLSKSPVEILENILSCRDAVKMDIGYVVYDHLSAASSASSGDAASASSEQGTSARRYFSVSCGIGFDAAVCQEALSSKFKNILNKIGLGKLTYLTIALKQLIAARKISCDIYLDGQTKPIHLPRFLFVAGMVHQYEGGGFMFCPDADYHDGLIDICAVGDIPKLLILFALPTAFVGKHYMFKGINRYSARTLKLVTSAPLWVHTDGEVSLKSDSITVVCEREQLQMLL